MQCRAGACRRRVERLKNIQYLELVRLNKRREHRNSITKTRRDENTKKVTQDLQDEQDLKEIWTQMHTDGR
jgi:hypothetical protein